MWDMEEDLRTLQSCYYRALSRVSRKQLLKPESKCVSLVQRY